MKILNVSQNYFVQGGSDSYFFELGRILEQKNHEVVPFCASSPINKPNKWEAYFPAAANFEEPKVADAIKFLYSASAKKNMGKIVKEVSPDLAHLHIYYGKLTASILKPLTQAGIPIVQTLHEYKQVCPVYSLVSNGVVCEACAGRRYWKALSHKCNRGSVLRSMLSMTESYVSQMLGASTDINHFIAVSDFQRRKLIELGVEKNKISTVHNFINLEEYSVATGEGEYFLYYGRIERLKGIFTLLQASATLKTPLFIVGKGESLAEVEAYIEEHQLTHVKLLGFQSGASLKKLIRGSICTILPAEWYEPFGLTVIESFASGRPVIGANIGGIPELIDDGKDGMLFDSGDGASLKHQLEWFEEHKGQAVQMGKEGRKKAERLFDAHTHYNNIMKVYNNL